jgi:hypothetical protein
LAATLGIIFIIRVHATLGVFFVVRVMSLEEEGEREEWKEKNEKREEK